MTHFLLTRLSRVTQGTRACHGEGRDVDTSQRLLRNRWEADRGKDSYQSHPRKHG